MHCFLLAILSSLLHSPYIDTFMSRSAVEHQSINQFYHLLCLLLSHTSSVVTPSFQSQYSIIIILIIPILQIYVAQKSQLNHESKCADNVINIYSGELHWATEGWVKKYDFRLGLKEGRELEDLILVELSSS